jgi:hypothetical protein
MTYPPPRIAVCAVEGDWIEWEKVTGPEAGDCPFECGCTPVLYEVAASTWEENMKWVRAFNSLEKPVTRHIETCMDADDLDRAHRAVMRQFGPPASRERQADE